MRDFGEQLFAGSASYYAQYRPNYPLALFNDIASFFNLDGHGKLLDLGCGTGEMAIPLAAYFDFVLAIDPDSEMLKYGRHKALESKLPATKTIKWQKASSKDLKEVYKANGPFSLVVMGQSFHWMDQEAGLSLIYEMTQPGGGVVIVGTEPTAQNSRASLKDEIIKAAISKYLGPRRRAGNGYYQPPPLAYGELFQSSKFGAYKEQKYVIKVSQNFEQILGNLYSMSWALPHYFGAKIDNFEAELKSQIYSQLGTRPVVTRTKFDAYFLIKK